MALCRLTTLLGDILPLIYDLGDELKSAAKLKAMRRLEAKLDEWEDSLPQDLNFLHPSTFDASAPGVRSLQVCYHTLKMRLYNLVLHVSVPPASSTCTDFHEEILGADNVDRDERVYHESRCRRSAQTLIDVVVSFQPRDWHAFWLPCKLATLRRNVHLTEPDCAYFFSSATTLMLRCALETESDDIAQSCMAGAKKLITYLRYAKNEADWDLADIPLAQCESMVQRMLNPRNLQHRQALPSRTQRDLDGTHDSNVPSNGTNPTGTLDSRERGLTDTDHSFDAEQVPRSHPSGYIIEANDQAINVFHDAGTSSGALGGDGWLEGDWASGNAELLGIRDMGMAPAEGQSWIHPLNVSFPSLWDMFRTDGHRAL